MARQQDLAQIGREGFDLIDRWFGKKSGQIPHEELEYHFENHPCAYHKPENPIITERLPVSPQPHYAIFRANDDARMAPQPFHQINPYGNPNPYPNPNPYHYPNTNPYPWRQPIAIRDVGQVHPCHGVMDDPMLARSFRGVAKMEVRWLG